VVVIAAALVILSWYSSADKGTTLPQTSLGTGGGTSELVANPGQESPAAKQRPQPRFEVIETPPCDAGKRYRSMQNGSRIVPDIDTTGHGELEVQNGTNEDAVLFLVDSAADETIREVYVQAKQSFRVKGIPKGTYELAYTHGLDWDDEEAEFRCDPDYAQFEREFDFTEERGQEGIHYDSITVTLHPVVGGNVRTKKISREEFLKNHRRTPSLPR
jgi:hypothetical protein